LAEDRGVRCAALEQGFGCGTAAGSVLDAAQTQARRHHHALLELKRGERHGDGVVAGAAAEFVEPKSGGRRQRRQVCLGENFIGLERGRHDALEMLIGSDEARASNALGHDRGPERDGH